MKKLRKILLINWLYFSKEIIEVGNVNFLTGKNGAGKSTVIDALQIVGHPGKGHKAQKAAVIALAGFQQVHDKK